MRSGIQSGNFNLLADDPSQVTSSVLTTLFRYMRSANNFNLENGFAASIKVLSMRHLEKRLRRGNIEEAPPPPTGSVNSKKVSSLPIQFTANNSRQSALEIPEILLQNGQILLKDSCLLAAAVLGYYLNMHRKHLYDKNLFKLESIRYKKMKNLRNAKKCERAAQELSKEMRKIAAESDIEYQGPHNYEEVLPKLALTLKSQFHVFSYLGNKRCYSHPPNYRDDLPQINIYLSKNVGSDVLHSTLITNLSSFFNRQGYTCLGCSKTAYR